MRSKALQARNFRILMMDVDRRNPDHCSRLVRSTHRRKRQVMDHGLPLIPVIAGVLLVYAAHFAYTVFHAAFYK
jgi:hypothetical protein